MGVELEMSALQRASPEAMAAIFRQVLMDALLAVATKYHLPAERLAQAQRQPPTVIQESEGSPGAVPAEDGAAGDQQPGPKTLKLYRRAAGEARYLGTWETPDGIVVHSKQDLRFGKALVER